MAKIYLNQIPSDLTSDIVDLCDYGRAITVTPQVNIPKSDGSGYETFNIADIITGTDFGDKTEDNIEENQLNPYMTFGKPVGELATMVNVHNVIFDSLAILRPSTIRQMFGSPTQTRFDYCYKQYRQSRTENDDTGITTLFVQNLWKYMFWLDEDILAADLSFEVSAILRNGKFDTADFTSEGGAVICARGANVARLNLNNLNYSSKFSEAVGDIFLPYQLVLPPHCKLSQFGYNSGQQYPCPTDILDPTDVDIARYAVSDFLNTQIFNAIIEIKNRTIDPTNFWLSSCSVGA
jgi:hypothetical protein